MRSPEGVTSALRTAQPPLSPVVPRCPCAVCSQPAHGPITARLLLLGASGGGRALPARPEDLDRVRHIAEAVLGRDLVGPLLDRGALDLDGLAAGPAHQVVMV